MNEDKPAGSVETSPLAGASETVSSDMLPDQHKRIEEPDNYPKERAAGRQVAL